MIKVSVIVPVYNVPLNYLRECFDSLAEQTMSESEFIIVSDGAPEAEVSICQEYASKDSRFKFFIKEHAGVSATRNNGIEQARGEYITFVDSDDWIKPETCEIVYNFAKKNNSDIAIWEANLFYDGTIKKGSYAHENLDELSKEQKNNLIHTAIYPVSINGSSIAFISCKLIKRDLLTSNQISFSEQLKCSEDRFFYIQCFLKSNTISYIKEYLYYYRIHGSSVSRKYTPNAYYEYTKFLSYLSPAIQDTYSKSIDLEHIHSFFLSWPTCYMNKENKDSYLSRMSLLKKLVISDHFHSILKRVDLKEFSFSLRIELFFLKHKMIWPIYLHGLKALLNR